MASPDDCATPTGDNSEALDLRMGALFGILLTSAFGIAVPYVCSIADLKAISYLRAFAGGVVLATGFVHILGDAVETLADPCLGWPDFPWAMVITTISLLATFNFEWLIHSIYLHRGADPLEDGGSSEATRMIQSSTSPDAPTAESADTGADEAQAAPPLAMAPGCVAHVLTHSARASHAASGSRCAHAAPTLGGEHALWLPDQQTAEQRARSKARARALDALTRSVRACTLEAGVVFHSVFIGLALGITRDRGEVRSLMIALMFHQLNEGLAIGIMLTEAAYAARKYWALGALFFLTTPVSIGIGIGVSSRLNPSSKAALATQGVLDAMSAGILLYNALVDFIIPTFANDAVFKTTRGKVAGFAFLYLGAGVMCLIAIWA